MAKVVIFTENNARIIYTDTPEVWQHTPRAVINPSLSDVAGLPPHHWKLVGKSIRPMGAGERTTRDATYSVTPPTNSLPTPVEAPIAPIRTRSKPFIFTFFALMGIVIAWYWKTHR